LSELLYNPHFHYNDTIVNLSIEVAEMANTLMYTGELMNDPKLRRANRIKSIHSSLAIENNSLTLEQVTDVINGKPVLAPPDEICEVKNADKAYKRLLHFNPYNSDDLEVAHGLLMKDLVRRPGLFRVGSVGVMRGDEVIHIAPRADLVSGLIADLLLWLKKSKVHPLIKSCIFHYEFEFIHPFPDGNGRMGRMWQTLLLYKWKEIFAWLPVETIIKENQQGYYKALRHSTDSEDCTEFIEFMLKVLHKTVKKNVEKQKMQSLLENNTTNTITDKITDKITDNITDNITDKITDKITDNIPDKILDNGPVKLSEILRNNNPMQLLFRAIGNETLSTIEIMRILGFKSKPFFIKSYIKPGLECGLIEMTIPDKPSSKNQRYRKNPQVK
jgi:Fic family protein